MKCINCGKEHTNKKYCSKQCMDDYRRGRKTQPLSEERKKNISKSLTGKKREPLSEEHKKKIGDSLRGQTWTWKKPKVTKPLYDTYNPQISYAEETRKCGEFIEVRCLYCGKWFIPTIPAIRNRIYSLRGEYLGENRLYCSTACKKSCPTYHKILYPADFEINTAREVQPELRKMVFERDKYTCVKCGKKGGTLHCHHIEGILWEPLESADIDKCLTVCKKCHGVIHKKDGCKYNEMRCV